MALKFEYLGYFFKTTSYGATEGKFSFVIVHNEIGWSATYKDREYTGPQASKQIMNGDETSLRKPFKTRQEAEAACRRELKRLKQQ